jgi:hypothetical protein
MERTAQTTERRTPRRPSTPAERFRPNGVAGEVPREGTQLDYPARTDSFLVHCALVLCCAIGACAGTSTPNETCEVQPDSVYELTLDGGAAKASTLRDAVGACSVKPSETCNGNVYTVDCNGVSMVWTVTSARGVQPMTLTLDTDSAGHTDHAEFSATVTQ